MSAYGVTDNRRLLLAWAGLVAAFLLGPFLAMKTAGPQGSGIRAGAPPLPRGIVPRLAIGLLLVALPLFLLVGPGVALHPINGHELIHLGYLNEIDRGRLLNVDTRVNYGPLLGWSIYLFMKTTSFSVLGFRLYWNVLAALFVAALAFLLLRHLRSRIILGFLLLYVLLHTTARYYLPDPAGVNGGFWGWGNILRHGWVTLAILGLAGPLQRGRSAWPLILAGAVPMAGMFYAQETGPPGFLVLLAMVALQRAPGGGRNLQRDILLMAAGAAAVFALFALPALLRGSLAGFLEATFRGPALVLQGAANTPYPGLLTGGATGFLRALPYYLLPGGVLALLLLEWIDITMRRKGDPAGFCLALYAALSYVTAMVRTDVPHLLNVSLAPMVAAGLLLDRKLSRAARPAAAGGPAPLHAPAPEAPERTRRRAPDVEPEAVEPPRRRAPFRVVMVLLAIPLIGLRPGFIDLARGLLGRAVHLNPPPAPGWRKIPLERAGIWTPAANWFDSPGWGQADSAEAARMIRTLSGGSPILINGNKASLYYFLSGAPCAIPYTDLPSQCAARADREAAARAALAAHAAYAFTMENFAPPDVREGKGRHYRYLGLNYGFYVYQRLDLPPLDARAAGAGAP